MKSHRVVPALWPFGTWCRWLLVQVAQAEGARPIGKAKHVMPHAGSTANAQWLCRSQRIHPSTTPSTHTSAVSTSVSSSVIKKS